MRILYLGNFGNEFSDTTEEHIKFAFEKLGHEVIPFEEKNFNINKILEIKADLFLFHKGGINFGVTLPQLVELLNKITYTKVFWYFDKVWNEREIWMDTLLPYVDYGFITDESWARRRTYKNLKILRQGIGNEDTSFGKFNEKYAVDVAFVGSIYGERKNFVDALTQVYKDGFRVFNNVFGRELYDLCASVKVIVAPRYPETDFYWSSRPYIIMGSGGFLIHPNLFGMRKEFEFGKHLVGYHVGQDLMEKINYYLEHEEERKKIQMAGYKYVIENFTYLDRVKEMLKVIQ